MPLHRAFGRPADGIEYRFPGFRFRDDRGQPITVVGMFLDHAINKLLYVDAIGIDCEGGLHNEQQDERRQIPFHQCGSSFR